jgi:phospholipid/cholesterol/gamma-HCH transport system ATP-binding protein
MMPAAGEPAVRLDHVSKRFGSRTVLDDVSFEIEKGKAFCLLGRSGTGKSVTLRHIIGLVQPDRGKVFVEGRDITPLRGRELAEIRKHMGFLFQNSALFDSMSVGDNVAFPMRRHTDWPEQKIREQAQQKLAAVGLEKDYDKMPADLSGGMKKRAGLARAMALDPDILLFDEPGAGLDPISSKLLDDLIVELRDSLGATIVIVTHELASIFAIATNSVFLDAGSRTMIATGVPSELRDRSKDERVRRFLTRGEA